ncbi:MAG: histidine kinase dimerization/phospho-acceptor domain-containing protein [Myxococcota bacterium]
MSITVPKAVRPSPAAADLAAELRLAGWDIRPDAGFELAYEVRPGQLQVVLTASRALAERAVEAGAVDALVWPDDRLRLPQALLVGRNAAQERCLRLAYTRAFRANPDWSELTDTDAVLLDVSEGFVAHSGYDRHEAIGRTPAQLFRAGTHGRAFYSAISAALNQRGEWTGDLVGRRRNGSWALLEARIGVVRENGRDIAHFASKRVPSASNNTSLRARVAASTTAPWVLLAPGGAIVDHSPAAPEVLGLEALLNANIEALGLSGPGDVWLDSAHGLRAWEVREERLAAGDIELVLLVFHDVTERKRHTEELDSLARDLAMARDQALAADQAKSAFLMSMSHELRTPLNAILGYTELLLELDCSEEASVDLQRIRGAGSHLLALVDDVLDLARVESGRIAVHEVAVDTAELLRRGRRERAPAGGGARAAGRAARRRRQAAHRPASRPPDPASTSSGTPSSTPSPARSRSAWTGASGRGSYVEDQGPGLTDAELQRVFQPFVQLQPQGSTGVGLGLAISTRLAHALGGALHAARADGGGTRFWLELPPTARG